MSNTYVALLRGVNMYGARRITNNALREKLRPLAPALQHPLSAQRTEMLRGPARVEAKRLLQLADRTLPVTQQLEDPHASRVAEHAEKLSLEHIDWLVEGHQPHASGCMWRFTTLTVEDRRVAAHDHACNRLGDSSECRQGSG